MTDPLHPDAPPPRTGRPWLTRGLSVLFAVLLALPQFQQATGLPGDIPLAGMETRLQKPVFSWTGWFDGSYAARYEKWLQGNAGFRGLLVRLASQANYSLFGRIGLSGGTEITRGRAHWLFETAYVKQAVRQPDFARAKASLFAEQAAAIENRLAARGIAFAVVIAPSKAEVLTNRLPPDIVLPPRSSATAYARIAAELGKRNVTRVDARRLFNGLKTREPCLFPKTGTHWSTWSVWLAWQAVAGELEARLPELRFRSPEPARAVMSPPLGADDDLRELLNLWHFETGEPKPLPYPVIPAPPPEWRDRHQALVVGDSFSLTMVDAMARSGLFRQIDLLYYFKRRFTYPAPSFTPAADKLIADPGIDMGALDLAHVDWNALLDNRQAVLLVINEINLRDMSWGFMESLLAALDGP